MAYFGAARPEPQQEIGMKAVFPFPGLLQVQGEVSPSRKQGTLNPPCRFTGRTVLLRWQGVGEAGVGWQV